MCYTIFDTELFVYSYFFLINTILFAIGKKMTGENQMFFSGMQVFFSTNP